MTNEAFLNRLQAIFPKKEDAKAVVEFAVAFLEGCAEELNIYTMGITAPGNPDEVRPLFLGEPEQRMMLCYTSPEEGAKCSKLLPEGDERQLICMPVSAHTVLDTALSHPDVKTIGFDMDGDHAFALPKSILEALLQKNT